MKDDVEKYIEQRKRADKAFAKDFESGYEQFKIGVMLRQAREAAGVTQEDWRASPRRRSPRFRGWRTTPRMCGCPPWRVWRGPGQEGADPTC